MWGGGRPESAEPNGDSAEAHGFSGAHGVSGGSGVHGVRGFPGAPRGFAGFDVPGHPQPLSGNPGTAGRPSAGGPRPEYLEAFDEDAHPAGTLGAVPGQRTHGPALDGVLAPGPDQPHGHRTYGAHGARDTHRGHDSSTIRDHGTGSGRGTAGDGAGPDREQIRKGGWGTLSGVAAAAVTTVLAIVVAGQLMDADSGGHGRAAADSGAAHSVHSSGAASGALEERAGDGRESLSLGNRPHQLPTYETEMSRRFRLDPDSEGTGRFTTISSRAEGPGGAEVLRYRVDVESGLPLDGELFAQAVHKTLNDERSWSHGGARSFDRVSSGSADFVITLASPGTTAAWCAKSGLDTTEDNVSCDSAATERVMINAYRWAHGADTFGDRMLRYREMLINHEVGHRLGLGHLGCEQDGALAPVMMQQTKTLSTNGRTCRPNAWPYP